MVNQETAMAANTAQAPNRQTKAKIFVSYSRKDMAFAGRLEAALKARGFEPLIDRTEIYAFEDWWRRIQTLIASADTIVFVLSPDAVSSDVALKEVAHARELNKRFAPIVCRRVEDAAVPEPLRRLNFIFFDDPDRFEASADQLAEALITDIGWVRQHTEFGEATRRWRAAGRPGGLLLRSPVLEEAERWIALRPGGAPEPTEETQAFVVASRRGTTRRRNILTGSLAAGLVVALALAGLAYWQRGIAIEQQRIADEQRKRAEATLAAATKTANSLVFDLAQRFRDATGVPAQLVKDILERARALQDALIKSGQVTPGLRHSESTALSEVAASLLEVGDTVGALTAAEQARQIDAELVAGNPESADYQHSLSVSYDNVGNVQAAQGDLPAALNSYQASIAICERFAKSNPGNAIWQRELSVSYDNIGDVQTAQGNLVAALRSYQASFKIAEALAKSNPGNAAWQRDLSVAYNNVGDVQRAQRDFGAALASYQAGLAVMDRVARSDPGNAGWQRDLSVSYDKVGNAQLEQRNPAAALTSYQASLAISDRLEKSDPRNADWQRDLAISYAKVGDAQSAQGNLTAALTSYQAGLAVVTQLAKSDPKNAGWQRDLPVSLANLARVLLNMGDNAKALDVLRQGQAIMVRMTKLSPDNSEWKGDLAWFDRQIAELTSARSNSTSKR
jgi:tetratricopeptide (TPR) repeat protein